MSSMSVGTGLWHTEIRKVGVIGAGQMGSGIAQVCALAGLDVVLNDVSEDRVKAGLATINGNMARQISKKRITEDDRQKALGHIASAVTFDKVRRLRPGDRSGHRARRRQAQDAGRSFVPV